MILYGARSGRFLLFACIVVASLFESVSWDFCCFILGILVCLLLFCFCCCCFVVMVVVVVVVVASGGH